MAKQAKKPETPASGNGTDTSAVAPNTAAPQSAEDTSGRAAEIVDEMGLQPIEIDSAIAQKIAQQVALAKFKTKVTWFCFRAKAGENEFRNADGSPKLEAIAASWPEFCRTLTVSARDTNALRFEAAERAVVSYFREHNERIAAGESGLIAAANGASVTVPVDYKGAEADREKYAEMFLGALDRFGARIEAQVSIIKAEREAKRKAREAAKTQAAASVKVATL